MRTVRVNSVRGINYTKEQIYKMRPLICLTGFDVMLKVLPPHFKSRGEEVAFVADDGEVILRVEKMEKL